jgi:tetratricopeptide (TPR) repeat protein
MEKFDKILELLEKKSLSEEEQKLLKQFADSDEGIKSFVSSYMILTDSLSVSGHVPTDLIASFVLFEKGDDSENKVAAVLSQKIKSHLAECSTCNEEYTSLLNEYSDISEHVEKAIHSEPVSKVEEKAFLPSAIFKGASTFRYAFATLSVLIVAYVGLFFISSGLTPGYKKNIFANEQEDFYKTRGRTSPLFQQGLNAIDKSDYSRAIEFLSEDIQKHQNERSIFYSHYIIGITYLKASEKDFFGLFKSYDRENVNLAIANLKESIDKNNSGDYESLKLDAYYYIGRAYLLSDERDSSISSLQKVVDGKGKYSKEAANLISDLEKN